MKLLAVALFVIAMTALTTAGDGAHESGGWRPYCPRGWTMFDTQCLYYVPENKTWAEAKRNCFSRRSNLVPLVQYHNIMNDIHRVLQSAGHENGQVWIEDCKEKSMDEILWSDGGTEPSCLQIGGQRATGEDVLITHGTEAPLGGRVGNAGVEQVGGGRRRRRYARSYPTSVTYPSRCLSNQQCETHLPSICSKLIH